MSQAKVLVVFRSRIWPDVGEKMESLGGELYERAAALEGFVSYKDFSAADGESVAIVEFASLNALHAWKNDPEHRKAKAQGRKDFFSEYQIQVCGVVEQYGMSAE